MCVEITYKHDTWKKYMGKAFTWSSFSSEKVMDESLYSFFNKYSFTRKFKALFSSGRMGSWWEPPPKKKQQQHMVKVKLNHLWSYLVVLERNISNICLVLYFHSFPYLDFRTRLEVFSLLRVHFALWEMEKIEKCEPVLRLSLLVVILCRKINKK